MNFHLKLKNATNVVKPVDYITLATEEKKYICYGLKDS